MRLEAKLKYRDGSDVWFDLSVQPSPEGIFVLSVDITERKLSEMQVRESNERFQHLANSLPQLIWACDANGDCDYLSQQWLDYTGVPLEESFGKRWMELIHFEDRTRVHLAVDASVASGAEFRCEFRIRRRDGIYRWFDARGTAQRDEQGGIKRWFGANMDIEEQKHARETQLRNQKIEALGALASGIAHDFNNVLLAITGNTVLALQDTAVDHPARESLTEIERASRRATDLVRRILAFSRQEEPQRAVNSLQPVTEEALKLLRATVPAQIELRTRFGAQLPRVICDATQVHQILVNLVTNAAYAIGDRTGVIEINLEQYTLDKDHEVNGLPPGAYARLTVADTGCGMRETIIERIFDPFFTTKPPGQGTGLGLSVVAGIMKAHGGAITVHSKPGAGTTFDLYFPATAQQEVEVVPESSASIATQSRRRVLLVDDDPPLVSLGLRTLTRLGYEASGESDSEAALARILENPHQFDVVITDLSMPRIPGFELVRRLREVRPDMPVIVTSGYVRAEDQVMAQQLNVQRIILKPKLTDELGTILEETLRSL